MRNISLGASGRPKRQRRPAGLAHRGLVFLLAALAWTAAVVAPAATARAEAGIVIGDSIGQYMAITVGLKSIAKTSFSVRRHDLGKQLARAPRGSIVLLSLGLNDAADPVAQLAPSIERAINAIVKSGLRVVWMGPPCVLKKWDPAAEKLDAHLKQRLASTAIQYVSLRDDKICARSMRAGDGEHFTEGGYRYLWQKIRADSAFAALIAGK